jgi:hypothetical protein
MTNPHPITPPPELRSKWFNEAPGTDLYDHIIEQAAQWGADQELLACGNYLKQCAAWEEEDVIEFYNYRRPEPKPYSLKEQALALLNKAEDPSWDINDFSIVRRALEQLPE